MCSFHLCCGIQSLFPLWPLGTQAYIDSKIVLPGSSGGSSSGLKYLPHTDTLLKTWLESADFQGPLSCSLHLFSGILLPVNFSCFTSLNLPLSLSIQGNHWALCEPLSLDLLLAGSTGVPASPHWSSFSPRSLPCAAFHSMADGSYYMYFLFFCLW